MMKKALVGIFFIAIIISGCARNTYIVEEVINDTQELVPTQLELYVKEEIIGQRYEPSEGIYLGAYTEQNVYLENSISNFDQVIEKESAFRVFHYSGHGDIQPINILECIAKEQIPYIKILQGDTSSTQMIYQLIGDIGPTYNMPIFIELFPVTESIVDPMVYQQQYQEAYTLLNKYIENLSIVWSVDLEKIYEASTYYPGEAYTDWVGLNLYLPRYKDGSEYTPDYLEGIDFWYTQFQQEKPLMLSAVAISHFSTQDYTYNIQDAKNKLQMIYKEVPRLYPRIKAIFYMDVDMREIYSQGQEDYRISYELSLVDTYKTLVNEPLYLEQLQYDTECNTQYMKYSLPAVEVMEKLYVEQQYIEAVLTDLKLSKIEAIQDTKGVIYYAIEDCLLQIDGYILK